MKFRTMVLCCLAGVVILAMGYPDGGNLDSRAQSRAAGPALKIGVVSVRRALRNCQATIKFKAKAIAENEKMAAEENLLAKEGKALADSLQALKPDSSDYMERLKETLQKQSELKALKEVNPRRRVLKEMQWTQKLYKEILRITKELGAKKGLALVLGADEPEFPFQRYEELVMTLSTHKVLYSDGCVDLTNEVIAQLDKMQSKLGM
ncbi:MAG: OmpH family outer membrane protein [Planctomycetes bacterium]|nr:OmpH family outer membrane protein [Planctomycetota bacterium]